MKGAKVRGRLCGGSERDPGGIVEQATRVLPISEKRGTGMRLTPEDAQVIDFLLDGAGQLDATGEMKHRMQAAQRVLSMLDAMPAIDGPSTNLIDLTLQRVEDASERVSNLGEAQEGVFIPPTTGLQA